MTRVPALEEFEGTWSLSRVIEDTQADVTGRLSGTVNFLPKPDGLIYEEQGTLVYGDQTPLTATRRYIWRPEHTMMKVEDGPDRPVTNIAVLFDDGRPFHVIETHRSMPDDNHHCDPDLYHVSYDFTRWPVWTSTWRVVGPKKDYRMVSTYKRP
ncbi:DUF6314 family protein [Litoreibacter roseus]|uniref:DUF6314 domain-containing protein n=1 Tax=Litoreibacter roseus TaxID=2601869 RepID=A0A6N6JKY5_9RHOB|nr:DUF6314 family protein [Litoreibacter roseus]GFE65852.1 hypothetical protein KIN_29260 [Litoreibacter roseus]